MPARRLKNQLEVVMMRPDFFAADLDPVTTPLICLDAHWQEASQLSLPLPLSAWLLEAGSLTVRLKQHCQQFRVQVLNEAPASLPDFLRAQLPDTQAVQVREVILWCNELPCDYAQSWLPQQTINALTPLADLGERPLGDYIFQQPGLRRGAIEVAQLQLALPQLQPTLPQCAASRCYARRSVFTLDGMPLLVAEAFLPAISQLAEVTR